MGEHIGIFGGSFNPIHIAHLIAAEESREVIQLDKILFIPTANPPHKERTDMAAAKARLEMVNLAVRHNKFFESSDIEIENSQYLRSYTIETLKLLKEKNIDSKLYLIIGTDNLIELHTWKEPEKLFDYAEVIVMNRGGYSEEDVRNEYKGKVRYAKIPNMEISSTEIRKRIRENKSIRYLVTESVEEYIVRNKLYL